MNVMVDRISETVMTVSWRPLTLTEARGFVSHYTVSYSPASQTAGRKRQADMTEVVVPGMESSMVIIDGLDPDTAYQVQVSASTGAGGGVTSEPVVGDPLPGIV